nr:RNA-directed DNA polymerase, eukaryota [Tanacetum cinerariifolium]
MAKNGKRFGFVKFINVFNEERLVNNLCTVWIDRYKLHANIARFKRPQAKNVGDEGMKRNEQAGSKQNLKTNTAKRDGKSYVGALERDKYAEVQILKPESSLVLGDECLVSKEMSKALFGRVKEFATLENLKIAMSDEGFVDLKIKYMGEFWNMNNAYLLDEYYSTGQVYELKCTYTIIEPPSIQSQYGHVVDSFIPSKMAKNGKRFGFVKFINVFNEERLVNNLCAVWIDRYKVHANIARFKRPQAKNVGDGESSLVLGDECLVSKEMAKALFGRVKEFATLANLKIAMSDEGFVDLKIKYMDEEEDQDDIKSNDDTSDIHKMDGTRDNNEWDEVPDTIFEDDGGIRSRAEGELKDEDIDNSDDPFNIYHLLNKNKNRKDNVTSGSSLTHPPGFTSAFDEENKDIPTADNSARNDETARGINKGNFRDASSVCRDNCNSNENGVESKASGHFKNSERPRTEGSILGLLDEVVRVGHIMGYKMEGVISNMTEIIESQGVDVAEKHHDYGPTPFRFYHHCKTQIKKELEAIDQIIDNGKGSKDVIKARADIMNKLHTCNKLDSIEAAQKAKVKWAVEGDENSRFFHGVINKKRNIRSIRGVMVDAFDSVRWDFLDDVLRKFDFGDKWCKWIQCCLQSSRGSIIINGSPTDEFNFGKGLKQGDPLSPFLFILVMETLHLSFQRVVDVGMFHVHVLDCFHLVSGLKINMNKSKLMGFLVDHEKVTRAANKLGCQILIAHSLYLGSYVGENMNRLKSWDDIIGRVRRRLSNWKMKMLSIGGRLTLVKSVLGSMPIFHMSLFKVPSGILRSLESIRSKFFNGIDDSKNKASWVQWSKALASKDNGGLG